MRSSWALTRGHRLRLFGLGVAVVVVELVVSAVFGVGGLVDGVVGVVLVQFGSALTTVFTLATLAAAYDQLLALPAEEETVSAESERDTTAAA
jgi:hypothetical protein